jgi:hypothetical protein
MRIGILVLLVMLMAGCGGGAPTATSTGQFSVTVSGAVQSSFSGGGVYVVTQSEGFSDITIFLSNADNTQIVSINLPGNTAAGTYTIDPAAENAVSPVVSFAQTVMEGENAGEITVYNAINGQVKLDSVNPMTGSFEFTGQNIEGQEAGVNGTFTGLPRGEFPTQEAEVEE